MNAQELSQPKARTKVLSNAANLDRLLRIMARWWVGWTWAQISDEHGISRQRVGRLLRQVGCTRALWCRADHRRGDSPRQMLASQAAQARDALLHRCAGRLTVRQRAALAWRALGLGSVATARRMATTPTNVRSLLVAARWRLERLSRPKRKRAGLCVLCGMPDVAPPTGDDGIAIGWDGLLAGIDDQRSQVYRNAGLGGVWRATRQGRHVGARANGAFLGDARARAVRLRTPAAQVRTRANVGRVVEQCSQEIKR